LDAEGWLDVRWMRVVERGGDRNEDARREEGKMSKEKEKEEEEEEEEEEVKEER